MKNKSNKSKISFSLFGLFFCFNINVFAQEIVSTSPPKSVFWSKVKFGGGLGLSFGNFTNVTIAPSAKYAVSEQVSVGVGLQYSYVSSQNVYKSNIFGGSVFILYNPVPEIQLSLDVEELNVNATQTYPTSPLGPNGTYDPSVQSSNYDLKTNYWTTALFVGGGYNLGGVTIGGRYNLLFDKNKSVYSTAFMPFVRIFF